MTMHTPSPAAGRRKDKGTDRRRGVQKAQHLRAAEPLRDRGKQRHRHAEEHRNHVDKVGAEQLLATACIAQAFHDSTQARPLGVDWGRHRAHEPQTRKTDDEGSHVDHVRERKAEQGDQNAAESRPEDLTQSAADAAEIGGCRELVLVDEAGEHRVERRPLDRVQHAPRRRDDEQDPHLRMAQRGVAGQHQAAGHQSGLAEQHHGSPVACIRKRAAHKGEREDGTELDHSQKADQKNAVRQDVNLVGKDDHGDHRAEERHKSPDEQQAEIAVAPERRDVDRGQVPPAAARRR